MKVYISADMEGIAGIVHWDEATVGKRGYEECCEQMIREVAAACEGALAAGATEIIVKDAHDTARNLLPGRLPVPTQLIRGWSGHPYSMVQELDASFNALALVGYHSPAGSGCHPLAHTMTTDISEMRLNGTAIAEFHLMAWIAAREGVPVVFVSGDAALCRTVQSCAPKTYTLATTAGIGESVVTLHPDVVVQQIRETVEIALCNVDQIPVPSLPDRFCLEIDYKHPPDAYRNAFYPGAKLQGERTLVLETKEWLEIMRALLFIL